MVAALNEEQRRTISARFTAAVNMEPADLQSWLGTGASHTVGWPPDRAEGVESVGHAAGRRILSILDTAAGSLSDDDYRHMRKVAGYVARHLKQRPRGDVSHTRWRYSLMNWGHDPLK
ncbi:MAG TPA: DUF3140 domain-containing protein [Devosia sp.]|nr:DUF3140 domain-containing protein [Devosia sp.]